MSKPNKRLRVAMLIDCFGGKFIGGGQTHVQFLSSKLSQNHNCELVIFSQAKAGMVQRLWWNIWVIPWVLKEHRRASFALIHAQAFSAGIAGKILSKLTGLPVIYSVHGSHTLDMVKMGVEKKSWKYHLEKLLLTSIAYDRVISDSAHFLDYSNVNKDITVIENGIEPGDVLARGVKAKEGNTDNLLFVGRLEKVKGVDILIKSMSALKKSKLDIRLRIVGDGSQKDYLASLVQDLNLGKVVSFLGAKTGKDLELEYQKADLFVLPSRAEGQAIVILDAWLRKLPVLVSSAGHNPWMIEPGIDGFIASAGSEKALTETLAMALTNRDKWRQMGEKGYKKAISQYSWDKTAQKTYLIYQELFEGK